jgi:hypothetical protein
MHVSPTGSGRCFYAVKQIQDWPIKNLVNKSLRRLVAGGLKFHGSETAVERHEEPSKQIYPNFLSAMIFLLSFLIQQKRKSFRWETERNSWLVGQAKLFYYTGSSFSIKFV